MHPEAPSAAAGRAGAEIGRPPAGAESLCRVLVGLVSPASATQHSKPGRRRSHHGRPSLAGPCTVLRTTRHLLRPGTASLPSRPLCWLASWLHDAPLRRNALHRPSAIASLVPPHASVDTLAPANTHPAGDDAPDVYAPLSRPRPADTTMETYHGHVRTPHDAIVLFEACRLGLLPRVQRRLSERERQQITSGSVFVWDEREAGMRRWTDGKSWSASRVSGSFLTYREMEGKRGGSAAAAVPAAPRSGTSNAGDSEGEGPDGYRYKADGLMKQSFSNTTASGQHLHLISYYARATANALPQPTTDAQLRHIRPPKNMYPDSTVADAAPAPSVARTPMADSPYRAAASPYPTRPGPVAPMYAVPMHYYAQHPYFYPGVLYAPPSLPPHPHPLLVQHPAYPHGAYPPPPYIAPAAPEHGPHAPYAAAPAPPPAPAASVPEQGPQLPAINGIAPLTGAGAGTAAAPTANANQPSTPDHWDRAPSQPSESNAPAAARPLPTLGSLLNCDAHDKEPRVGSRSSSRSPHTVSRLPRDLAPERLAKNSSATDSSALNKLNSVFVRS